MSGLFDINPLDPSILVPLVVAVFLGMLIGLERSLAGKSAGMRTYALVALGSCLFILLSRIVTDAFVGLTAFDPLRVAAAIVMGVGFIGTGIAWVNAPNHGGLTTAAGIWVAAGIGMASGFELYGAAVATTALTLIIFTIFWRLEHYLERISYKPKKEEDR